MNSLWHTRLTSAFLCLFLASPAQALDQDIKELMQELLQGMAAIQAGILMDDYRKIATNAEAIVYHRGPNADARMAISNELGMEARTFQILNDSVRRKARTLKQAAEDADQEDVLDAYNELTKACTHCHNSYRKRLRRIN